MTTPSTATTSSDPTLPNYARPEVGVVSPDLKLVRDLLGGTRPMHDESATYIRKWKDEDDDVYDIRRKIETVFEGLGRTLSAAVGMLFAKSPQITWNNSETAMSEHWDNVDGAGTKGTVLVKRFTEAAVRDGLGAIMVDHTPMPIGSDQKPIQPVTAEVQQSLGLRPTWAVYSRSQVINWRTAVINNQRTLSLIVFHEQGEAVDGEFGIKTVHRYRVVRLLLTPAGYQATWSLWQLNGAGNKIEDFSPAGGGVFRNKVGKVADFLPVSIAYTGRTDAPLTATIPLLGVAWANLAHWRASTNLAFYRELAAFPQPVVVGELAPSTGPLGVSTPGKLRVGPMVAVHLKGQGSSFVWAEITGTSMAQLESGIKEKLAQMGQLGMSFLTTDTRAAETADAKRLDATAENSTLSTAAQGVEDAVNSAYEHHAWYLGIDKAGAPVMAISRDYESTAMDPSTMVAYVTAVRDAGLPIKLLLEAWQAGGRIPPDTDLELLEAEMQGAIAAADAQKRQAAADANPNAATNADTHQVVIQNPDGSTRATMTRQRKVA